MFFPGVLNTSSDKKHLGKYYENRDITGKNLCTGTIFEELE